MRPDSEAGLCPSDGRDVRIAPDAWGRLVMTDPDGGEGVVVEPVRAFPLTAPDGWVSLCDLDGREVLCLRSLDGLDADSRRALADELGRREFVPVIRRILKVSAEASPSDWEVQTDRGPNRFTLDSEDDIRQLGPNRLMITDSRKIRYLVSDTRALDGPSRRMLDRFL